MATRNSELYPAYFKDVSEETALTADQIVALFGGGSKPEAVNTALLYLMEARNCDVSMYEEIDVYAVCLMYSIGDETGGIAHGFKKLLLCGQRTGDKSLEKDLQEAFDAIYRACQLNEQAGVELQNKWLAALHYLSEYKR